MEFAPQPVAVVHDRFKGLDRPVADQVGGDIHAAASAVKAHAEFFRRLELRAETIPAAGGHHVMVVGGGRATREHHFRQGELRAEVQVVGGESAPEPVHVREPRQQRQVVARRVGARHRLVEVVVRVDESRRGDAAARIVGRRVFRERRRAGAHGLNEPAARQQPGVAQNLAPGVHRHEMADVADKQVAGDVHQEQG